MPVAHRFQNHQQQRPPHSGDRRPTPPAPYARPHQLTATPSAALADTTTRTFCCEPCDRSFATADELHCHRAQHQRCTAVDGCPFEGHAQLVAAHVQQQHNSGLYERIRNLTTPEEIERWREERRRKYPSAQNVELRQQIQAAKQQRGERLEPANSRFGAKTDRRQPAPLQERQQQPDQKRNDRNPNKTEDAKHDGNKPKRGRKKQKKPKSTLSAVDATESAGDQPDADHMNGTLHMFRGTATMKQYKRPRVKVVNALSGLLGAYDSDDDEDDESDNESEEDSGEVGTVEHDNGKADEESAGPAEPPAIVDQIKQSAIIDEHIEDVDAEEATADPVEQPAIIEEPIQDVDAEDADPDNGPPDEAVVQRTSTLPDLPANVPVTTVTPIASAEPKGSRKRPAPGANAQSAAAKRVKPTTSLDLSRRYRNQNTMLEKLLQKDIRHERNVLLQCVRYVVAQKFFGVGQPQERKENEQK